MVIRHNDMVIDRSNMSISIGERVRYFNQTNRSPHSKAKNICFVVVQHLILNGWTKKKDLYDLIWGDSADGGPLAGENMLDIRFHQWRPELSKQGLKIVREKRGGVTWYKIVSEPENV